MSGKKDPKKAPRALNLLKMNDLWVDSAPALKSKYMKMETFKYLKSL